jgi:hypothetical protein
MPQSHAHFDFDGDFTKSLWEENFWNQVGFLATEKEIFCTAVLFPRM